MDERTTPKHTNIYYWPSCLISETCWIWVSVSKDQMYVWILLSSTSLPPLHTTNTQIDRTNEHTQKHKQIDIHTRLRTKAQNIEERSSAQHYHTPREGEGENRIREQWDNERFITMIEQCELKQPLGRIF